MTTEATRREVERQLEVIRGGAEELIGEEALEERLIDAIENDRPLRVKLGMDPSAPDLHLGHTVVLGKLKRFQDLGHTPIFLIGDFTARIGDPTGKKKTRPTLDEAQVKENAETYVDQVGKVLDISKAEVRFNSEWVDKLTPTDFVRLCSKYTVARILERDDFEKRYRSGEAIGVHEFMYPFVQAYDSVALEADVEIGGTDQKFNLLMAREIQRAYGQKAQTVLLHPILVGTDGHEKMSKSLGNTIGITDSAEEMYGKTMRVSDETMLSYYDNLAWGEWPELEALRKTVESGEGNPMEFKQALASKIVARFHGAKGAEAGAAHFRRVVQDKDVPEEVPELEVSLAGAPSIGLLDLMRELELTKSNGEGRRLVVQGAVQIDGEKVLDPVLQLGVGTYLVRAGKRRFAKANIKG